MIRSVVIAMSVLAVVGCSSPNDNLPNGETGATSRLPLPSIEISLNSGYVRKTIRLDVSTSVRGPDLDENGVRDDVDTFIGETSETSEQLRTAHFFALTLQSAMNLNNSNPAKAKTLSVLSSRAAMCIFAAFDGTNGSKQPKQMVKDLREITMNTKERLQAYLAYMKSIGSTSGDLPKGDKCEDSDDINRLRATPRSPIVVIRPNPLP